MQKKCGIVNTFQKFFLQMMIFRSIFINKRGIFYYFLQKNEYNLPLVLQNFNVSQAQLNDVVPQVPAHLIQSPD